MGSSVKGYCPRHDAYFSYATNQWMESKCRDPECDFCAGRPFDASTCDEGDHRPVANAEVTR